MKKFLEASYLALIAATSTLTFAGEPSEAQTKSIEMFPEEISGYTRHVIRLPKLENEAKLELLPAKVIKADTCNRTFASVDVEQTSIPGWGYSYLTIKDFHQGGSTMMACPDGEADVKVFANHNKLTNIRYNDRMPLVVYVEDGLSLDYKIWRVAPSEAVIEAPAG